MFRIVAKKEGNRSYNKRDWRIEKLKITRPEEENFFNNEKINKKKGFTHQLTFKFPKIEEPENLKIK